MKTHVDRVVALTGGARGIGLATAELLLAQGARVAIGDLDEQAAIDVAERLGERCIGCAVDVRDADSFAAFLGRANAELGRWTC